MRGGGGREHGSDGEAHGQHCKQASHGTAAEAQPCGFVFHPRVVGQIVPAIWSIVFPSLLAENYAGRRVSGLPVSGREKRGAALRLGEVETEGRRAARVRPWIAE